MKKEVFERLDEILKTAKDNHLIQSVGGETFCPVCGNNLVTFFDRDKERISWKNPTQKAHRLSNDKPNMKKFGKIIIEDKSNHMLVCGLNCNNDIQVRNNPVEAQKIIIDIILKYITRHPTITEQKRLHHAWTNLGEFIIDDKDYENKYNAIYSYFKH